MFVGGRQSLTHSLNKEIGALVSGSRPLQLLINRSVGSCLGKTPHPHPQTPHQSNQSNQSNQSSSVYSSLLAVLATCDLSVSRDVSNSGVFLRYCVMGVGGMVRSVPRSGIEMIGREAIGELSIENRPEVQGGLVKYQASSNHVSKSIPPVRFPTPSPPGFLLRASNKQLSCPCS